MSANVPPDKKTDFDRFKEAMAQIVTVPLSEVKDRIESEKTQRKQVKKK